MGASVDEGVLMSGNASCDKIQQLLDRADVRINGDRPWDVQVLHPDFYARLFAHGTMGLGESYMDGWWECPAIDEMVHRAFRAGLADKLHCCQNRLHILKARLSNRQKLSRAYQVGEHHYDIGNDLYERMLDHRMIYSCAYWKKATSLDAAQEAKLELVCHKLGLEPGMHVLDIGCGWGGMAHFAAERHGVSVTGVTVSREQAELARQRCQGWPVDIRLQDYRTLTGKFDRILSLGMFEHVGYKNYRTFMRTCRQLLTDTGLLLLHTIGSNQSACTIDPWIDRYIFPNAMLPSASQISRAFDGLFVLEDWHNFGVDYDRTLIEWHTNLDTHWPRLEKKYGERFRRMWRYYLLSCAGSFRSRENQLWQIVLAPQGVSGGYQAPR